MFFIQLVPSWEHCLGREWGVRYKTFSVVQSFSHCNTKLLSKVCRPPFWRLGGRQPARASWTRTHPPGGGAELPETERCGACLECSSLGSLLPAAVSGSKCPETNCSPYRGLPPVLYPLQRTTLPPCITSVWYVVTLARGETEGA